MAISLRSSTAHSASSRSQGKPISCNALKYAFGAVGYCLGSSSISIMLFTSIVCRLQSPPSPSSSLHSLEELCKALPSPESLRNIIIILGLTRVAADTDGVRSRTGLCQALPKGFRLLIPQSESQIHMISICFQRYAAGVNNRDSRRKGRSETHPVDFGSLRGPWEPPEKLAELSDF